MKVAPTGSSGVNIMELGSRGVGVLGVFGDLVGDA